MKLEDRPCKGHVSIFLFLLGRAGRLSYIYILFFYNSCSHCWHHTDDIAIRTNKDADVASWGHDTWYMECARGMLACAWRVSAHTGTWWAHEDTWKGRSSSAGTWKHVTRKVFIPTRLGRLGNFLSNGRAHCLIGWLEEGLWDSNGSGCAWMGRSSLQRRVERKVFFRQRVEERDSSDDENFTGDR